MYWSSLYLLLLRTRRRRLLSTLTTIFSSPSLHMDASSDHTSQDRPMEIPMIPRGQSRYSRLSSSELLSNCYHLQMQRYRSGLLNTILCYNSWIIYLKIWQIHTLLPSDFEYPLFRHVEQVVRSEEGIQMKCHIKVSRQFPLISSLAHHVSSTFLPSALNQAFIKK